MERQGQEVGEVEIGVIGGSGLYEMEGLEVEEELRLETPFGRPSDALVVGCIEGHRVAFLARHGRGHRLLPTELPFRANIWAMKSLGVQRILAVSAVGSMRDALEPRHVVVPDQFIDRTRHRVDTFFGRGLVAHVSLADPICPALAPRLAEAARQAGAVTHEGGTYLCMEGPQFSTRAESMLYRSWGVDIIGMTNLQEARLAREAEICYATLAMVTDYDCWHETEEDVSAGAILAVIHDNVATAQDTLRRALPRVAEMTRGEGCSCHQALQFALVTPFELVPDQVLADLEPILRPYRS